MPDRNLNISCSGKSQALLWISSCRAKCPTSLRLLRSVDVFIQVELAHKLGRSLRGASLRDTTKSVEPRRLPEGCVDPAINGREKGEETEGVTAEGPSMTG
jgi:hypothetical protein